MAPWPFIVAAGVAVGLCMGLFGAAGSSVATPVLALLGAPGLVAVAPSLPPAGDWALAGEFAAGARVLAKFGDDPMRYATAKTRKNYAATIPITRQPGTLPDQQAVCPRRPIEDDQILEQTTVNATRANMACEPPRSPRRTRALLPS